MTGGKNPSRFSRCVAWLPALIFSALLALAILGAVMMQALTSEELHVQTATGDGVVGQQMERVEAEIRDLAEEYHFDADRVIAKLSADELRETDRQMAEWWTRIVRDGVMDETPRWSSSELRAEIESTVDPASLEADETAGDIAREVGYSLEKTVQKTLMPVRRALITMGVRVVTRKVDLPAIVRLTGQLPPAAMAVCLLLAGVIALLLGRKIRVSLKYYGAAFAGAGISVAAGFGVLCLFNIPGRVREASEGLANQMSRLSTTIMLESIGATAVLLAAGYACLVLYQRGTGKKKIRNGEHP